LQRYQENLAAIIDLVPTETPIIVVSPPCYSSRGRARDINIDWVAGVTKLERDPDGVREYGLAARGTVEALQKARLRRIAFCDVHQPMENAAFDRGGGEREEGLSHFLHDGVHLTSKGYKVSGSSDVLTRGKKANSPGCDGATCSSDRYQLSRPER
jgi:lysophospholipase L1-like esterase